MVNADPGLGLVVFSTLVMLGIVAIVLGILIYGVCKLLKMLMS